MLSSGRFALLVFLALLTGLQSARATRRARAKAGARRAKDRFPPLVLVNPNRSRERLLVARVYDRGGRFRPAVLGQFKRFFRCRRTGRLHPVHPRLIRGLYRIARAFRQRPILVYSGYRHPSVAWTRESFHTRGLAADIAVQGISKRRLRDHLLARFPRAGVGYYVRVPFVHFDVRGRPAFWIDFSGPGERPRYASNARRLLALERRGIAIRDPRALREKRRGERARVRSRRSRSVVSPVGPPPQAWAKAVAKRSSVRAPGQRARSRRQGEHDLAVELN